MAIKRVGLVSTRLAGPDGVSLEAAKWRVVLERLGYECFAFAGEVDNEPERSLVVEIAHFDHPEVAALQRQLFGSRVRDRTVTDEIHRIKELLVDALYEFIDTFDLDLLIAQNVLAIPMHVPLGVALTQVIAESGMPVIAHHHDFSWERDRFRVNACEDYLQSAFPPDLTSIRHVVINSYAAEQLSHRKGLSNDVIPNVWDFERPHGPAERARELRRALGFADDEVCVLQPTRVVARKQIERAVDIVRDLGLQRLVLSHPSGDEGERYPGRLHRYAASVGVELVDASPLIMVTGGSGDDYRLDDAYQAADVVTYPSGFEGFGNGFVEAVYNCKPIVMNRYSVYVSDIEPKGFDVIAFEGFAEPDDIEQIRRVLADDDLRRRMTQHNFELGRQHFSYEVLADRLGALVRSFG